MVLACRHEVNRRGFFETAAGMAAAFVAMNDHLNFGRSCTL
jgi:hypothetical protein